MYNLFQFIFYCLVEDAGLKEGGPTSKKIRPPKVNTWAGDDGRAKGGGWLHTSQWLSKEILVYNLFQFSFLLFGGGRLCNRKGDLY